MRILGLALALVAVFGCGKKSSNKKPETKPVTAKDARSPTAVTNKAKPVDAGAVDAAPYLKATGPCKVGKPVVFCGKRWPAKTEELVCHEPRVNSLKPVACLRQLRELDVSKTGVADLRPLNVLNSLEVLELRTTKVRSLKQLRLGALQSLDISNTQLSDRDILKYAGLPINTTIAGRLPAELKDFDCIGEGSLRARDGAPHNGHSDGLDCHVEIAAGCDGTASATLRRNGRKLQTKRTKTVAAKTVRVKFRKRPQRTGFELFSVDVDIHCGKLRKRARDRFGTNFLGAE